MFKKEPHKCCDEVPCIMMSEPDHNAYALTIIGCKKCGFTAGLTKTVPDAINNWNGMLEDMGMA